MFIIISLFLNIVLDRRAFNLSNIYVHKTNLNKINRLIIQFTPITLV